MNNNKTIRIGIVIVAAIAAMMILGTNLTTILQQQASASSLTGPLKDSIVKDARAILNHKENHSQHLNQENLCYRSISCKNSNIAQQIDGNDNSVTGFADQSVNN
jgi:hypothetical protein